MDFLWTAFGQRPCLKAWEDRPFWPGVDKGPASGDRRDVYERELAVEGAGDPEPGGPYRHLAQAILRYDIFPPQLLSAVLRRAPIEVGDTVGVCYHLIRGLDLFFAARVTACFDEFAGRIWRTGFTYHTLTGHPELGEETFSVEKVTTTGRVSVALRSWSRPGILLARILSPWVRVLQVQAGRGALDHLNGVAIRARERSP